MTDFIISFLFANSILSINTGLLFAAKYVFRNNLSSRMQYHIWFLLLGLFSVPFLSVFFSELPVFLPVLFCKLSAFLTALFHKFPVFLTAPFHKPPAFLTALFRELPDFLTASFDKIMSFFQAAHTTETASISSEVSLVTTNNNTLLNDFAVSFHQQVPSYVGIGLFILWLMGVFVMSIFMLRTLISLQCIKSRARLAEKHSHKYTRLHEISQTKWNTLISLNKRLQKELGIRKYLPVYRTRDFDSPVLCGIFFPCILLPESFLLNDSCINEKTFEKELRYILLHELVHYKQKDNLVNLIANLVLTLYWFNPVAHLAMKQMRNDREIACDTAVLQHLRKEEHADYGKTLLNLAGKMSGKSMTFATGISSSARQLKRRIINIISYKTPSSSHKNAGRAAFVLITTLLLACVPSLSSYASNDAYYSDSLNMRIIALSDTNFSELFAQYDKGTFVLLDSSNGTCYIYNEELARTRVSPVSTYKIYDALLALEQRIISPENTYIAWDGTAQPFKKWEQDQTLSSAIGNSVNWYFQKMDAKLGRDTIQNYLADINYGNQSMGSSLAAYWGDGSLKISPLEQVLLLQRLNEGQLSSSPESIAAVKSALLISETSSETAVAKLYGKTGTALEDGKTVMGWFVGFFETADNTYYFATLIQDDELATGSMAAQITHMFF